MQARWDPCTAIPATQAHPSQAECTAAGHVQAVAIVLSCGASAAGERGTRLQEAAGGCRGWFVVGAVLVEVPGLMLVLRDSKFCDCSGARLLLFPNGSDR